jgi:hypothetical protein
MSEKMKERCKRICGSARSDCFSRNAKQLACLSDLVINSVCAISSVLEMARAEQDREAATDLMDKAMDVTRELVNWVKYLQLTHDIRELGPVVRDNAKLQARREWRYPLPEVYKEYIGLNLAHQGVAMPATLINFSKSGLQFRSPVSLETETLIDLRLFTRHVIDKEVAIRARVKYILVEQGDCMAGARIEEIGNQSDFDFFANVLDFIRAIHESAAFPDAYPEVESSELPFS